jgi:hypothetical protein
MRSAVNLICLTPNLLGLQQAFSGDLQSRYQVNIVSAAIVNVFQAAPPMHDH